MAYASPMNFDAARHHGGLTVSVTPRFGRSSAGFERYPTGAVPL